MDTPKNSGKAPSFQFYYKDWLEDQRLKRASKKAKGCWIDLISCSMGMPTPGIFADGKDGKTPLKRREIDGLLTGNPREIREGIAELIKLDIFKQRREDGAFYVKRIYEDMRLRQIRQEAGRRGGNPILLNQNPNHPVNQTSNQIPTPSARKMKMKKKKEGCRGENNSEDNQPSPTRVLSAEQTAALEERRRKLIQDLDNDNATRQRNSGQPQG